MSMGFCPISNWLVLLQIKFIFYIYYTSSHLIKFILILKVLELNLLVFIDIH